jgi:DNA uptake protein ComE-like DNA-binding protein
MTETRQEKIQSFAFVIGEVICLALTTAIVILGFIRYSSTIGGNEITLDDKINPNYAPVASLVRLPNIGCVRARAIVAYRQDFVARKGSNLAFRGCNDLQKIKGIGPKTAQNISQWLRFE